MNLLKQLYDELYQSSDQGKKANLTDLARQMNSITGKSWTWRALNNVLMGYAEPGPEMEQAIRTIAGRLDNVSPLQALPLKQITAYSINGHVTPGAIILGESKRCVGCGALFVPNVPWRKWCVDECRITAKNSAST